VAADGGALAAQLLEVLTREIGHADAPEAAAEAAQPRVT
jgi:hypothetical protein